MFQYVMALVNSFRNDEEEGQGLVEYALILVLISIAAIVIMGTVGDDVNNTFSTISGTLQS